ncbi:PepSY domain-containing protein [Metabacillus arenae]|uniref:PepSY domain-containing protein n=1 Tax=Metabacillus arenae TaxID=2771434 RepID=A0A926RVX5_9BACI|nr:PepSY domain-containing protein [Metabacillus arenae]MBD1380178.1 PepSY domain-containing protein [Metabacillus arenae]
MNWRNFFVGVSIGFAAAYFVKNRMEAQYISSEKALHIVKQAFKQRGPIDGSWIYTVPEEYYKNHLTYKVYKTGVTRTAGGSLEQYEALVDAKTGTIIEIIQTA